MKVNLSEVRSRIVGRGRKAYENPAFADELRGLNPADPEDAILWEEAQGDPKADDWSDHKARWRNRAESVADALGLTLTVAWSDRGECIVSLRAPAKGKRRK